MQKSFFLLFTAVCILISTGTAFALGPEQIHLTWQNDSQTTMTVEWATGNDTTKGVLEYGIGDLSQKAFASPITYPGASRKLFVAEATGLSPGALYQYRVGDGATAVSPELTFKTAPAAATDGTSDKFRFIAFGDSRGGYDIFGQAITRMLKEVPDLFIFTGDATVEDNEGEWDSWFLAGEPAMSTVPFMPTFGNHDALAVNYFERFALPQNATDKEDAELYYSFEYGNAKFIVLNDNYSLAVRPSRLDGPEFAWFENELKTNRKQWLFVVNHQPFYSASNKHGSDISLQRVWLPLIDKYKVDMVFNGHDHNYERSFPMRNDTVQATPSDGTIFVVAAGVGAPLYENGRRYHTAISESKESYVVLDIDGLTLNYTAKRLNGTVIEHLSYTREPRVFASGITPATEKTRGVLQGPLWSCSGAKSTGSDTLGFLIATLPLVFLRRRKRILKFLFAGLVVWNSGGCAPEDQKNPVPREQPISRRVIRLDERGTQGTEPGNQESTSLVMASQAQTMATQLTVTRTHRGFQSTYLVTYPGNATGFTFERDQTQEGVEIKLPADAPGQVSEAGAQSPTAFEDPLLSQLRNNKLQAESLAALFDNADAGEFQWIPAWPAQGTTAETGFSEANLRIPLLISWPGAGEGDLLPDMSAAQVGPALGKLLCGKLGDTVRDGVQAGDGYLPWETGTLLPVPPCRAQRALIILFRGMQWSLWNELAKHDELDRLYVELLRDRGHLSAMSAQVHGPASAQAGEVEWLTGAIPAHAGYINGAYRPRKRVGRIDAVVDGLWKVYGGSLDFLAPLAATASSDAARLNAADKDDEHPEPLQVVFLDEPAAAVRKGAGGREAIQKSADLIANTLHAWRDSGRLDQTVVIIGATHGIERYVGAPATPPALPDGWKREGSALTRLSSNSPAK